MKRTHLSVALAAAAAVAIASGSCASGPELPPVGAAGIPVTPGRAVWHDLVTEDLEVAKRFYGGLFGWTFRDFDAEGGDYALASLEGRPVAGLLQPAARRANVSQWLTYFSVEDVEAAVAAARGAGAEVVIAPREVSGKGRAALLVDPQGAPLAVARLRGGDPPLTPPAVNDWLWVDLWTPAPAASAAFYGAIFGLEARDVEVAGAPYRVLGRGARAYAGLIPLPQPEIRPNWLPIVRVQDARATAARALELGGRVLLAPSPEIRQGKAAIVGDPAGGAVAIHEWDVSAARAGEGRAR